MKLGIYTIEKKLFEGDVDEIIAKTTTGEISILPNHIPLMTRLVKGWIKFKKNNSETGRLDEQSIEVSSGFLEVQPENSVVVLADTV
jgi:F-type H+-transporting ATPase subunit epsilon